MESFKSHEKSDNQDGTYSLNRPSAIFLQLLSPSYCSGSVLDARVRSSLCSFSSFPISHAPSTSTLTG